MLPKRVRDWCRNANSDWASDAAVKWPLVLRAYAALGEDVPDAVRRKAAGATAAGAPPARRRKRKREPDDTPPARRPKAHYCPISHEIMRDPVVCPDGHSYEKEQLETWLRVKRTSPLTQQPIPDEAEFPRNHALRDAIERWCARIL